MHVLQDDVIVVGVLEQVDQGDNVRMLRYFQDVDLATLLVDLDLFHVFLVDRLNCHFLSGLLMRCELD